MVEQRMSIGRMEEAINVFGSFDENIRLIESELHVAVTNRDGELKITGEAENVLLAARALKALLALSAKGEPINEQNVRYVLSLTRAGQEEKVADLARDVVCITAKGRPVKAKTIGQRKYVESIQKNTVTIGVGPCWHGQNLPRCSCRCGGFPGKRASTALSSPVRRWKPASAWAFCPAICRAR